MDYQNRLLAKKEELEQLIKEKKENMMIPVTESTGELSMYDQHPGDIASELYEREKDYGLIELLELELEKVNDAMDSYNRGQYGICQECGKPIEQARLNQLVNSTLCADCARMKQNKFTRPAEEDISSPGDMSDEGETFQIAGYEFYE